LVKLTGKKANCPFSFRQRSEQSSLTFRSYFVENNFLRSYLLLKYF